MGKHHLALGFATQLPTASDPTLGSEKWSAGPSFDYEFESGPLVLPAPLPYNSGLLPVPQIEKR